MPCFLHAQDTDMNQTRGYKGEFCWSWFLIYGFGAMLLSLSIHSAPFATEAAHSLKKPEIWESKQEVQAIGILIPIASLCINAYLNLLVITTLH